MPIRVVDTRFLRAGNRIHAGPVLLAWLAVGSARPERARLDAIAGVLHEFRPPGPDEAAAEAGTIAAVIADLAMALAARGREPDGFRSVLSDLLEDPAHIAIACRSPTAGRRALETACLLLADPPATPPALRIDRFVAGVAQVGPFEEDAVLAATAEARGIHWRLSASGRRAVLLGEGRGIRRSLSNLSDRTGFHGAQVAHSKALVNLALERAGFPAARQRRARDGAEALAAAAAIGYPVVVKPVSASRGQGVSCNLGTEKEVASAFRAARRYGQVIVEGLLRGDDHRMLVIDGKVVSCSRRRRAGVTGDGVHTVDQLVASENSRPERRLAPESPMMPIVQDHESDRVLGLQSLTRRSVPEAGRIVDLRSASNWSQGGSWEAVMDLLHPENARMAEAVARHFDLDVVGIDVITTDIGRPLRATGGAINEVQRQPAIREGAGAARGTATPHQTLLDYLVPAVARHQIPIMGVVGAAGADVAEQIADRWGRGGRSIGLASTRGLRVEGRWLSRERHDGRLGIDRLVDDPTLEALVVEADADDLLVHGLGHGRLDVAVSLAPQAPAVSTLLVRLAGRGVVCAADDHGMKALSAQAGKDCTAIPAAFDAADVFAAAAVDLCRPAF